jgi:hypothetical protein
MVRSVNKHGDTEDRLFEESVHGVERHILPRDEYFLQSVFFFLFAFVENVDGGD